MEASAWRVLLSMPLLALALHAPASPGSSSKAAVAPRVLYDFDGKGRDLDVAISLFAADPDAPQRRIDFERRPGAGGDGVLHVSYRLQADRPTETGLRLRLDGLDAARYDHLSLRVKGDSTEGYADSFKVAVTRPEHCTSGLIQTGSEVVSGITDHWHRVTIPLNRLSGITDWSCLQNLVISWHPRREKVEQGAYYFDDIALIETGHPGPSIHDAVIPVRKKALEREVGGPQRFKAYVRKRLGGWPEQPYVDKRDLPDDDRAFLRRLARDTWRGLAALTDREHGLPIDTLRLAGGSVDLEDARIGDYTNVTNIGLYLIAVVGAMELDLIDKDAALDKLRTTLATLEQLETYEGFFYNYYDTTTLERTSNFISFVDSSWLTAGLMVARQSFPELSERCSALIEQGDYGFFYDDVQQLVSHGFYVNLQDRAEYHYGLLYTEARLGSLVAIGKGDVPEASWYRMARTFHPAYSWQTSTPKNRRVRNVRGYAVAGGYYESQGKRYIPSWGGSLFEALMPTLVVDEQRYAPASLGANDLVHAQVHRRYALEELGYPVWGMSPSSVPGRDDYGEYGVKALGVKGYGAGAVTPHAAALALSVTPEAAVDNLRRLARRDKLYGPYGLYDAIDPLSGEVAHKYLALDQAMTFIALTNYLDDRIIQRRFAADPIADKALELLPAERFFE